MPLSLDNVAAVLTGLGSRGPRLRVTPEVVIQVVSDAFGVAPAALTGERRDGATALARHVAMYLMREASGVSLADIGAALGGRDHSTVRHGCEKIAGLVPQDEQLRRQVAELRQELQHARHAAGGAAPVARLSQPLLHPAAAHLDSGDLTRVPRWNWKGSSP